MNLPTFTLPIVEDIMAQRFTLIGKNTAIDRMGHVTR